MFWLIFSLHCWAGKFLHAFRPWIGWNFVCSCVKERGREREREREKWRWYREYQRKEDRHVCCSEITVKDKAMNNTH